MFWPVQNSLSGAGAYSVVLYQAKEKGWTRTANVPAKIFIERKLSLLLHSIYHLGGLLMRIFHDRVLGRNRSGPDLGLAVGN